MVDGFFQLLIEFGVQDLGFNWPTVHALSLTKPFFLSKLTHRLIEEGTVLVRRPGGFLDIPANMAARVIVTRPADEVTALMLLEIRPDPPVLRKMEECPSPWDEVPGLPLNLSSVFDAMSTQQKMRVLQHMQHDDRSKFLEPVLADSRPSLPKLLLQAHVAAQVLSWVSIDYAAGVFEFMSIDDAVAVLQPMLRSQLRGFWRGMHDEDLQENGPEDADRLRTHLEARLEDMRLARIIGKINDDDGKQTAILKRMSISDPASVACVIRALVDQGRPITELLVGLLPSED